MISTPPLDEVLYPPLLLDITVENQIYERPALENRSKRPLQAKTECLQKQTFPVPAFDLMILLVLVQKKLYFLNTIVQ